MVVTETVIATEPKISTLWPLTENCSFRPFQSHRPAVDRDPGSQAVPLTITPALSPQPASREWPRCRGSWRRSRFPLSQEALRSSTWGKANITSTGEARRAQSSVCRTL